MRAPRLAVSTLLTAVAAIAATVALLASSTAPSTASSVRRGGGTVIKASTPVPSATATPSPSPEPLRVVGVPGRSVDRQGGRPGSGVAVGWLSSEYLRTDPAAATGFDPQRFHLFRVAVEGALLKAPTSDLKSMLYLREESGREFGAPAWIPMDGFSARAGLAAFPNRDARDNPMPAPGSRFFEIVIRDLGEVKERVFRWDL